MDAKDFEAKQHLFMYELNKIDNDIKSCVEYQNVPAYHLNTEFKNDIDTQLETLKQKRTTLSEKYAAFEDSIYNFLVS